MKTKNRLLELAGIKPSTNLLLEEEGDEAEAEDEEESPEEEAPEEESIDAEPESEDEEAPEDLSDTIDADIEAVLIDFEAAARKTVEDQVDESISLIYETTEEIDLDQFAGEVARLVKNYENLLDMEKMLVDKAKSFITNRYGEAEAADLEDKLATQHDIDVIDKKSPPESSLDAPLAVGAASSGE